MKKLLSILLVIAMLTAYAIPAIATEPTTETEYDIQITSDIVIDERFHQENYGYSYWWDRSGKLDAIVDGKELKGITMDELEYAVSGAYDCHINGRVDPSDYGTWAVGSTHKCTVEIQRYSEETNQFVTLFSIPVNVSVQNIIESITACFTIYEGGFDDIVNHNAVIAYKDGTTSEEPMHLKGEANLPTELGIYDCTATIFNHFEIPATIHVIEFPADIQITSDIVIDERIHNADGDYLWNQYGKLDAIVAGKEFNGITMNELRQAISEAYGHFSMFSWIDSSSDTAWTVGSVHQGTIQFRQWSEETSESSLLYAAHVNVTVQNTIESIVAEPITCYPGGFGREGGRSAVVTYKDGSTKEITMEYRGEWPTEVGTYEKTAYVYDGYVEVPVTINVVPFTADIQITSDIVIDKRILDERGWYRWNEYGIVDAIVAGKEFKGITMDELEQAVSEAYGNCYIGKNDDQYNNPWTVGSTHKCGMEIYKWAEQGSELLFATHVNVAVQDIIESIVVNPITVYEGGYRATYDNIAVVTYRDGSTEETSTSDPTDWPTEIGTYTRTVYVFGYIEVPVTINVVPFDADIKITSDIIIDEQIHDSNGRYLWYEYGKLDAIIAGKEFKGITMDELEQAVSEAYGDCYINWSDDQYGDSWTVGSTHECSIEFWQWSQETGESSRLYATPVNVTVQDIIESIVAETVTIYEGGSGIKDKYTAVVTYKDGSTTETSFYFDWSWPTEIGTYERTVRIYGCIEVPVTIKVVPYPTSGKCGDNMTWTYDVDAKKLTISGTGAMYTVADEFLDVLNGHYEYCPEFWHYWEAQDIVVEEGVEYLSDFAFVQLDNATLQLPSTLKKIPQRMFVSSLSITELVIPEGITSLTGYPVTGGCIEELYLPGSLEELDVLAIYLAGMENGALKTIHFAGTEEQWNAIKRVKSEVIWEYLGDKATAEQCYADFDSKIVNVEILFEPKAEITVEDGVATVPDSAVEVTEGEDVVIDVTGTEEKADSVVLGAETVDKIADAEAPVEVKLPDASVSFDKTAIGSINEQAGESPVTIVAQKVAESTLNAQQTAALEKTEVCAVLTVEAFAGETKITDFDGGKVTISIPFELPEGKEGKDFYVAYVADDGTVTAMPTTYADGKLTFETTHFSSYAVVEKAAAPNPNNPQTGDSSYILLFTALMVVSAAALAVCTTKRRAF